jgi:hypothetical protein
VGSLDGASDRRPSRDNDVDVQTNEFGDERREAICSSFGPPFLDDNVFSFDVPQLAQSPTKCIDADRVTGSRPTAEKSYPRDFGWLLRSGREWRTENGSARDGDERSPIHHSITRSARSSSDCGIVRPRALAVFKLMTNSNLLGCSIGRSPGFAPLRILSTKVAARRSRSKGLEL